LGNEKHRYIWNIVQQIFWKEEREALKPGKISFLKRLERNGTSVDEVILVIARQKQLLEQG